MLGRSIKIITLSGSETSYSYDKDGNLTQETDPLGNKIQHQYTLEGWFEKTIKVDGTILTYTHDKTGTIIG